MDKAYVYSSLPSAESPDCLPMDDVRVHDGVSPPHYKINSRLRKACPWIVHLVLFSISLSFAAIGLLHHSANTCNLSEDVLLGKHSIDRTVRFNGAFNRNSPFKGPPSAEVDNAWAKILPVRLMSIPEDVFLKLNASKHSVETPSELGQGRLAIFEALHQIHCVESLWKATYPDYYPDERDFVNSHQEEWHEHMDHCADILRQKLMCDADSGLITYNWLDNHYNPHPNFNVEHKCRDYNRLLAAVETYGINMSLVPEGGILRPTNSAVVNFTHPPFSPFAEN